MLNPEALKHTSGMGDHQQSWRPVEHAAQSLVQVFRIERGETLIQDDQVRLLE
jgi:hypothetical protein